MKHTVITIARSYGSGGRTLGKKLAEELGIHCYDRELIRMASDESGINEALFGEADEKLRKMPLFRIAKKAYHGEVLPPDSDEFVSNDNLFNYQAKIIREVAKEESCIIIGRCADYVLKDCDYVKSLFFYAPRKDCIERVMQQNGGTKKDIEKKIQIDEMRKEFLSNVSHELKTPIALIQGYAEGLYDNINDDSESRKFYCEVIMDEADKMNKMVKKLLTLNQIEFGNNQVNFEHFDIVQVVRTVINSATLLAKQKEAQIEIDDYPQIYVWADEYMIEEVVTNYVSNAINHVDGEKKIKVSLKKTDKVVRVSVFNTGKCIPEEELDKIWIKFYKVDKARTREYGGSGIGLSIVKAIMESMNQKCGVLNHEDGVEFWFELDIEN